MPRAWPSAIANRWSATNWDVNAFVDATPISGPACVYTVPSASRVAMLPTTLQIATLLAPSRFASRSAPSVSAVSPDCVMAIASVCASDDRPAVAEFGAVVDFDRHPRHFLDQELPHQARMP